MSNLRENPLKTKADLARALTDLIEPLTPYYQKDDTQIQLSATGAGYSRKTIGIEGLLRVLWGLAPLLAGGGYHEQVSKQRQGMINGTNPDHEHYWGDVHDYDQIIVEMAAIGYSLALAPEHFWQPLTDIERQQLVNWLSQVNQVKAHDCNWLFFAVIVNIGLKKVGQPYDQSVIDRHLDRIEHFYLGEGWYKDGHLAHIDYYGPFALHFYGLFYATMMGEDDPVRSTRYKERAKQFIDKFVHWFSPEGQAIPYGRSLTYRFSQIAFFSIYVFAEVDPDANGWIKGVILRHLRYWFKQPIFDRDGILTVGYRYPNLLMSENYNAPGSPYWALKSFLFLALPDDHLFWQVDEESLPDLAEKLVDDKAEKTIIRDTDTGHLALFPSGYSHTNGHTHVAAKYEKFCYSTHFGFSVPRSESTLDQGAFDSILAVSENDDYYRVKRQVVEKRHERDYLYMLWKPWPNVAIKTWIIPGLPWHVRIHLIESERELRFADGGYAIGTDQTAAGKLEREQNWSYACYQTGVGGAAVLKGVGKPIHVVPNGNTNIMTPNTIIPTITGELKQGVTLLVHAFYGKPKDQQPMTQYIETIPIISQDDQEQLTIQLNGQVVKLDLSGSL